MAQSGLDPKDWDAFRAKAHEMLDAAVDQMAGAADHPWQPLSEDPAKLYAIRDEASSGTFDPTSLVRRLREEVLPHHGGNIHPRFWGWVQGSGLASDFLAAMASVAVNANLGGRNHGANEMERIVIDWARSRMGLPETASGVFVTGTSQATVLAFQAARLRVQKNLRKEGQKGQALTAYAAEGVHNATKKALELLGVGSDHLRSVPLRSGQMDFAALRDMIRQDRAAGALPFLLVGTAGSVDLGLFDNLDALADAAQAENLWLHVDGAFGAWTRIADNPYRSLTNGIERADSIALDFHKWFYVSYDCGLCLMRNEEEHRAAFAARPYYLEGAESGLAGGEPWFCDYGIDLSRGNRAIKVWAALEMFGEEAIGKAITGNCQLAALMGQIVEEHPEMSLAHPVVSNICAFTADKGLPSEEQSELNARIATALQESGEAVFSTTKVGGVTVLRAAIANHRTQEADIHEAMKAVAREARRG